MVYSLSTSWNFRRHSNGVDLINEIKALGFDSVELNFALTKAMVDDVLSLVRRSEVKVSSLHNICPLPPEVAPERASPDYYSLASCDDDERGQAVRVAKNTIRYARDLGAEAVVLHLGRVEMKDRTHELASLISSPSKFQKFKEDIIKERSEKAAAHISSVSKSLKELVPYAGIMAVKLAAENRYYYREIPLADELGEIFRNFTEKELFYWHDVGHAAVFERLGFYRQGELLERFQNRLLGMLLHDIIGPIGDHNPPGLGTFDYTFLKPYMKKDILKVLEIHSPATPAQIRRSVEYLDEIFADTGK
jgi:sugar phosphate isomerase/epimerase